MLEVGNFTAAELVELWRDDDEGQVASLAPGFEQGAVNEHEVELSLRVATLAIPVQEQHHGPVLLRGVSAR